MKTALSKITLLIGFLFLVSCGNPEKTPKEEIKLGDYQEAPAKQKKEKQEPVADLGDPLANKGIGPIKSLEINDDIHKDMAANGQVIFKNLCSSCHKMDKKFVGPALANVTERRSPEWIMNMILNPDGMIKEDPIAKQLVIESNMAVMANQNLTEEEARAILEYFRELDKSS